MKNQCLFPAFVLLFLLAACGGNGAIQPAEKKDTVPVAPPAPPVAINTEASGPSNYSRSVFLRIPECRLDAERNFIYSASPTLAFEELYRYAGLKYRDYSAKKDVSEQDYIAICGRPDSVLRIIEKQMTEKFGVNFGVGCPDNVEVISYALLYKKAPFEFPFADTVLNFKGKNRDAFFVAGSNYPDPVADQVQVCFYSLQKDYFFDEGDFIVKIRTKDNKEEIVIACIRPEATLQSTMMKAERTLAKPQPQQFNGNPVRFPMRLSASSGLLAPDLKLHHSQDTSFMMQFLQDNRMRNMLGHRELWLQLDENGAELVDSMKIMVKGGSKKDFRLPPLVVNRPFLLMMQETGKKHPYLLMWVNNPEIMPEPVAKKN